MLANYTIGVPSYPVHGMPMQTSVPIVTQQALPAQQVPNNTSGLLEFSQMLVDTKVGMSRIDLKLDEVLKKVDSMKPEISSSNAIVPLSKSDTPLLVDPAMVLHSITQVVEESRALKKELVDRDARIEALNQKSRQLLESNQRYVEQSQQMMAQKSDSIHSLSSANSTHIIKLQEENSALKARVDECKRKLDSRNLEMGEQESDVGDLRKRNELLSQKMNQARNKFREKESEIEDLKSEIEKLHREAGKQKNTRQSAQKEATDLNETIEELRENVRTEKQSKKKIHTKLTRLDEELTEVKSDRDRILSTIEDKRKKQQNEKSKLLREIDEIKRGYEEELSVLKSQVQQTTGPTQADLTKIEANWKRKMQEGIATGVSELEEKCEELEASELKLKSQVQRLEKKVTTLSIENSHLQQENNRVIEELDELESVKSRDATSQDLIDKQNVMIEQFNLRESELRNDLDESKDKARGMLEDAQLLGEKIRYLESQQQASESEDWRNRVRHAMNKFYASVQSRFISQKTFTGLQVQELLIEAIKVETERVLRQDTDSAASTETEDSADEANTPRNNLPNVSIGTTNNQLNSHSSQSPTVLDPSNSVPQQSADQLITSSSPRVDSPVPQQSADLSVTSSSPRVDSPVPQQSADLSVTSSSPRVDSPVPQQSADLSVTSSSPRVDSPVPQQSADQLITSSSPRLESPIPQQSADRPVTSSSRLDSPVPQQSADLSVTSSSSRLESSIPQQSADQSVTSSSPRLDSRPANTRIISVEFEDSVDTVQDKPVSSTEITNNIYHTVVPIHSDIETDQQTPQPNLSPVDQTISSSPPLDRSPISSPIPIESKTQSAPDQSPISSPNSTKTPPYLSPNSSPVPYQYLSQSPPSHIPLFNPPSNMPDISDNIQEYSQSSQRQSPPPQTTPTSPPPSDRSYKPLASHSASPPPMDLQTSIGGEPLTTGNFSPELIDRHFSNPLSDDKISSLDAILESSFPSLEVNSKVKPETKQYSHDTTNTMDVSDVNTESNPLLEGSGDSENEIFMGPAKKKEPPPIELEKPIQSNSLFEDSDDDLDWLNN